LVPFAVGGGVHGVRTHLKNEIDTLGGLLVKAAEQAN
jgi:hypothetical protein